MDKVHQIKLVNGDEIYGVLEQRVKMLRIYDPLRAEDVYNEDGSQLMLLVNYIPFSERNYCDIDNTNVLTYNQTKLTFAKFYYLSKYFSSKMDENKDMALDESSIRMAEAISHDELDKQSENGNIIEGTTTMN